MRGREETWALDWGGGGGERRAERDVSLEGAKEVFPGGPVAKTSSISNTRGTGLIPGQGTKTPHAAQSKNNR